MNGANRVTALARVLRRSIPTGGLVGRARSVGRSLSALSFWGAIALPGIYLPLLVSGIETTDGLVTFLLLFGLHVSALVGGRRHRSTAGRRTP